MCGIILGRRKDKMPIGKSILKRYKKQRERGHEGFGFITIDDGKISGIHRFEKEIDSDRALQESTSSNILFHHRLPTSTPNYAEMTHPIVVKNKMLDHDYYVVHNGVLQNDLELKDKHEKLGFEYTTNLKEIFITETISGRKEIVTERFNDSESLAIEVALFLDGKQTMVDAVGSIAFVCIEADKKGNVLNIHYGRNVGNPLMVEDNNDLFFIKSTGNELKIDEDEILTINYATGERTFRSVNVGRKVVVVPRYYEDDYKDHMRTIGFGAYDKDSEEWNKNPSGILTPNQFLPKEWEAKRREDRRGIAQTLLSLPYGKEHDSIILDEDYEDIDWGEEFGAFKLSDEYLLELWAEIETLKQDIKDCRAALDGIIPLSSEDIVYNEAYLYECLDTLETKQNDANKLEMYLKHQDGITRCGQ